MTCVATYALFLSYLSMNLLYMSRESTTMSISFAIVWTHSFFTLKSHKFFLINGAALARWRNWVLVDGAGLAVGGKSESL